MTEPLYQAMALPDACRLDKRVYKKLFLENDALTAADRRLFRDHVDTVTWKYTFKPETVNIPVYEDEEREYNEIAILEVALRKPNRADRLANVIHRAIPYPVFLVLVDGSRVMVHLAPKRTSRADSDKWTLESEYGTQWIDIKRPNDSEEAFLQGLALRNQRLSSYFDLYAAWIECITALNCAEVTGRYDLPDGNDNQQARCEKLTEYAEMKEELASYHVALKDEGQFSRRVELNMKIKQTVMKMDGLKEEM